MLKLFLSIDYNDPAWSQHMAWVLGHPTFWFVLIKWILVWVGVAIVVKRLLSAKRFGLVALFLIAVAGFFWWVDYLTGQAAELFKEARGNEIIMLRIVGLLTDAVAIFVAFYVVRKIFKKNL